MAKLGFGTAAGSSNVTGGITAVAQGKSVDPLAMMKVIKEGGAQLGQKLMEVAVKPTVVAAKKTIAYAVEAFDFGGSINKFNDAASGVKKDALTHTGGRSLRASVPRQKR